MGNKHLCLKPHNISRTQWWYETPGGIEVVQEARYSDPDMLFKTVVTKIPWRSIRSALARKDKEA